MSDKLDGPVSLEMGLDIVHNEYVMRVIKYLETKVM